MKDALEKKHEPTPVAQEALETLRPLPKEERERVLRTACVFFSVQPRSTLGEGDWDGDCG